MQLPLNVSVFLILGLINPFGVSLFAVPEELEGSGYTLDDSGSADGPEPVLCDEVTDKFEPNTSGCSSSGTLDCTFWPAGADLSESVLWSDSKSILNNQEVLAGLIVGGVVGAIIGAAVSAVLIYRRIKKDGERNRKKAADEDYHKPIREEAFV